MRGAQSFRELPDWQCDVPGSAAAEGLHLGQQWGGPAAGPRGSCRCGKGCGSGAPWAGSAERRSAGPPRNPGLPALSGAQEFEIELEGSQTLRVLCYEKRHRRARLAKEDGGESVDRIAGKGQVQVRQPRSLWAPGAPAQTRARLPRRPVLFPA